MYLIFSNTGIQFYELPWVLPEHILETNFETDLRSFLANNWTLLSLDGSVRDYARLFWRKEEDETEGVKYRPVLAIDTKTDHSDNSAFLRANDGGRRFTSKTIDGVIPENSENLHRNWIIRICNGINIDSDGIFDAYRLLLQKLIEGEYIETSSPPNEDMLTYGFLGGFDYALLDNDELGIDTNLYIDLGNSRTSAIIYEDIALNATSSNTFYKLDLLNYKDFFGDRRVTKNQASHESIFPSLMQFRESPIPTNDTTETFKLLSIAAIGFEALGYKITGDIQSVSAYTGMSSPKRYLWDYEPFPANWFFANKPGEKIKGEILNYISLDDPDKIVDAAIQRPVDTNYPRRSMVIHFFVELLEQVIRSINSYNHRKNALPDQPRRLKRIVVSFPSAFSDELSSRLLKQLNKAVEIIKKYYTVSDELSVDLGIDEASTVQCVFIQNHIYHSDARFFKKIVKHQNYHSDNNKLRIASIDIGGGTTDVMVSEFDLTETIAGAPIHGKILFADGIQYGGDVILQKLINKLIIPSLIESFGDTEVISDIQLILSSSSNETKHLRLGLINAILYPLSIQILNRLDSADDTNSERNLLDDLPDENMKIIVQHNLKSTLQLHDNYTFDLIAALNDYRKNLGDRFLTGGKINLNINGKQVSEVLMNSSLLKTYINQYAKICSSFSPSFVLLAGKLSELDLIRKSLVNSMCFSPERIIPISKMKIGRWYPYRNGDVMEDAKTTVCVGMAIADITRHAAFSNGLAVKIIQNGSATDTVRYYYKQNHVLRFSEDDLLLDEQSEYSQPFQLHGNKYYIFGCRVHIIPTNPPSNFGSIHYELNLQQKFNADDNHPPTIRLKRSETGLIIDEDSISGNVLNTDGESIECKAEHIRFLPKNIHEDFFLDTGTIA